MCSLVIIPNDMWVSLTQQYSAEAVETKDEPDHHC